MPPPTTSRRVMPPRLTTLGDTRIDKETAFVKIMQSHEYGPEGVPPSDYEHVVKLARKYPEGIPSMTNLLRTEKELDFRKLLSAWPLNQLDVHGYAPIHYAAAEGKEEMLQMLLKAGAKVDILTSRGSTALCLALQKNHYVIVRTLLDNGASPSRVRDSCGLTPLCRAVTNQEPNVVKLLLEYDAEVNEPDAFGFYPIHRAANRNLLEILEILVAHGARVNSRAKMGEMTPLHLCYDDLPTTMFLLENGANASATDKSGRNAKGMASYALGRFGEIIEHARKARLKTSVAFYNLYPLYRPLLESLRSRQEKIRRVRLLRESVERGMMTKAQKMASLSGLARQEESIKFSPIRVQERLRRECLKKLWTNDSLGIKMTFLSEKSSSTKVYMPLYQQKLYWSQNIDPNAPLNKRGETALHIACGLGSVNVVRKLLNSLEADPWRTDFRGQLPLHTLSQKGFVIEILDLLYKKVGDMAAYATTLSSISLTPMDCACMSLLKPHESDEVTAEKLAYILALGKYVGVSALPPLDVHFAAQKLNLYGLKYLLEKKEMDVNGEDLCNMTPLHWASRVHLLSKQDEVLRVCKLLLDKGAKVNARDNFGFTPLHRCRLPKVAAYLIERGCDPEIRTKINGSTAYDLAVQRMPNSTRLGFRRGQGDEEKTSWRTVQSIEKSAAMRLIVGTAISDYGANCLSMYMMNFRTKLADEAGKAQMEDELQKQENEVAALLMQVKEERNKVNFLKQQFGLMEETEHQSRRTSDNPMVAEHAPSTDVEGKLKSAGSLLPFHSQQQPSPGPGGGRRLMDAPDQNTVSARTLGHRRSQHK